ncbi:MAG: hypothetical protein AB2551_16135 [Candidatus Thiodiazotropha sp.]
MNFNWILPAGLILSLLTAGCGNSVTTVTEKRTSEVVTDKRASYIIFSRPESVGAALTNTIVEFIPHGDGLILVSALTRNSKAVYKTIPGEHYFYMQGGENDDMIKVDAAPGKIYYIHTAVGMGLAVGRFNFKPIRHTTLKLKDSLVNKACDKQTLDKHNFEPIHEDHNYNSGQSYNSPKLGLDIVCKGKVIKSSKLSYMSMADISGARLVEMNETKDAYLKERKESYMKEISEDYPDWAENNYGGTTMTQDDGFPIAQALRKYK